jgi:hypothetical protein
LHTGGLKNGEELFGCHQKKYWLVKTFAGLKDVDFIRTDKSPLIQHEISLVLLQ